jgi:hypothetical protein
MMFMPPLALSGVVSIVGLRYPLSQQMTVGETAARYPEFRDWHQDQVGVRKEV